MFLVGGAVTLYAWRAVERPGPLTEARTVLVPKGTSLRGIAAALEEAGVVGNRRALAVAAHALGAARTLRAGEYAFEPAVSIRGVIEALVAGRTVVRKLTVPEGLTTAEIVSLVATADGLDGEIPEKLPAEGELLPDTYHFSFGDGRAETLARMAAEMRRAMAELWPQRAQGLPFETSREALVLASIVEKETGVGSERARVAAVFVNRLRRGMKLDADPTVIYAITRGGAPLERELSRADLQIDDPYNTYRHTGLPPGPIANPGRAAIEAALNPAGTDDLYFVADGTGGHVFARTYEEHLRNVAKWRRLKQGN